MNMPETAGVGMYTSQPRWPSEDVTRLGPTLSSVQVLPFQWNEVHFTSALKVTVLVADARGSGSFEKQCSLHTSRVDTAGGSMRYDSTVTTESIGVQSEAGLAAHSGARADTGILVQPSTSFAMRQWPSMILSSAQPN
ncbi:MAG: hypothetical protein CMH41_03820 [Micrococcales bacterium]|nr:hypothetical protein [Micrococcales bacterium]